MPKFEISTKRVAISKANTQMVAIVGAAAFLTIFCLFAAKATFKTNTYQAKVSSAKSKANKQLDSNITNFANLKKSYASFDDSSTNIIGGQASGTGNNDGTNSQIVLDSLPSSYDFPALASSLEKLLVDQNYNVESIAGTDDQVNQQSNLTSPAPTAVPMPFSIGVKGANYTSTQKLVDTLEKSIRPIQVDTISIEGGGDSMKVTISAHTYYQPGKNLDIKKEALK